MHNDYKTVVEGSAKIIAGAAGQSLADIMTLHEHWGTLTGKKLAYVGNSNNVAHSLLEACALSGVDITIASPDGYQLHGDIIANAKAIAAEYDARLQLLHVIEETVHPSYYIVGKSSIFDIIPDIQEKTRDALQNLIKDTPGPDVEVAFHVAEGQAATEIIKFAKNHNSDMIVISTHGLTGLEHLLVGSVAEKVVRSADCPVFTVKPFGKSLSIS